MESKVVHKEKVFFAIPSYKGIRCLPFLEAFESTVKLCENHGYYSTMSMVTGNCYVQYARNKLIKEFIDSDSDTLFFLDDDVSWKPEDVLIFLKNKEDDIIAGIYTHKNNNEMYPVVIKTDDKFFPLTRKDGLIHGSMIPFGFVRIKRNVITKMISKYPELKFVEVENGETKEYYDLFPQGVEDGRWWGEDFAFCRLWNKIGGEIFIVPNIELKHHYGEGFSKHTTGNYHEFLLRQPR